MKDTQVVLGFDMETDVGSWTPFYEGLVQGAPHILEVLERHDVSATFFFTAASAEAHPEIVGAVKDAGHEIACHGLFHETIGDPLFDIPGDFPLLAEEVGHRLLVATERIETVSGVRPVSFRAPRLWGSTKMINTLEELGYRTDASYPMYYYRKRLAPYHPSRSDWTEPGDSALVELPNFADLSSPSSDPYGRDLDQWPLFRTESAAALLKHVDGFAAYSRAAGSTPFLCFYMHPWEFHPMPQGDIHFGEGSVRPDPFIVKNCGDYAVEQLDLLVETMLRRGAVFHQAVEMQAQAPSEGTSP